MASIHETAYPRLKPNPDTQELEKISYQQMKK